VNEREKWMKDKTNEGAQSHTHTQMQTSKTDNIAVKFARNFEHGFFLLYREKKTSLV